MKKNYFLRHAISAQSKMLALFVAVMLCTASVTATPPEVAYLVPYSGTNEITACSGTVQDHGGNGDYGDYADGSLFIYPETPGDLVQLTFTQLEFEEDFDYVEIYDNDLEDAIAYFDACPGVPVTITAVFGNGLEVYFYSDFSNIVGDCGYGGFTATISCVPGGGGECTLEADAGEDVTICQGFTTQLNGSYTGEGGGGGGFENKVTGSGEVYYEWSPTTGLDDPYIANPTANPTTTTTYTLTVYTDEDCFSTDEVTVTVTPAPPAAVTGTTSVCEGGAIVLIASGGNCYVWTGPDDYTSTGHSFSRTLATPAMSGIYTVYVGFVDCSDGEVCPATATIYVTVHPKPLATISGASPVCSGGSISLSAPSGAVAYAWSGPGGYTAGTSSITRNNATSLMSGLYKVTVTGAGGCTTTASKSVVVSAVTTATISGASSFCSGNTISLTATTPGVSYQWSGPGGFSFSGANMTRGPATSAMAGTYWVTVTNAGGCISIKSKAITIAASPTATISAPLGLNPNVNGKVYLIASGGNSYSWSGPGGFSFSSSVVVRQPATMAMCGLYTVTVTGSGGCTASASVYVTVGGSCGEMPAKTSDFTVETLTAYPNPSINGLTKVFFTAQTSTRSSLSVFAIDGREVGVLFNDITVEGSRYEFDFNTNSLAPGIYFVVLRTENGNSQQLRLAVTN